MTMIPCPKCEQQLIHDDQEMCPECLRLAQERKDEERRTKVSYSMLAQGANIARKVMKALIDDAWDREQSRLRPKVYFWAIVLFIMFIGRGFESDSTPRSKNQNTVINSSWDGSVSQVKSYLQGVLKDPDSFQAIEWSEVVKSGSGYAVRCKYRAKNSFGGYVIEEKLFLMDSSGRVTDVIGY